MFSQTQSHKRNLLLAFVAAGCVVLLDQLTKYLWRTAAVLNTGLAFSWQSWSAEQLTLGLSLGFAALVIFVSFQLLQPQRWSGAVGYGLLLGGGFSNLFDRWQLGGVRDIWSVPFLSLSNNAADWAIFLAVVLLVISEIIPTHKPLWNRK